MQIALLLAAALSAQQLEPRAYSPAPVGMSFAGLGYSYTSGDVVLDQASPIQDVKARIHAVAPYYGRTFGLLGRLASAFLAVPLVRGEAKGALAGEQRSAVRTGAGDPQLRLALNLLGGPALSPEEFRSRTPRTTLGTSLIVTAPAGQYDSSRLFNLGTNRWAFKPELGVSHPAGPWILEAYAGAWLFTSNDDYLNGRVRKQEPLLVTQAHVVRSFGVHSWGAFDFTYYAGGATTVDGVRSERQSNTRAGLTASFPLTRSQSLKLAYSRGVTARVGSKFSSFGCTWQYAWF